MYTIRTQIEAQNLMPRDRDLPFYSEAEAEAKELERAGSPETPAATKARAEAKAEAAFLEWIAAASNDVDDGVGEKYPMLSTGRRFAAWPATPYTIQQCAAWLAASYGLIALGRVSRSKGVPSDSELYRTWAEDRLTRIREGDVIVHSQAGVGLDTGQAPLAVRQPKTRIDGISLERFL